MLDFLKISTRSPKRDVVEIYPTFMIKNSSDLMIRGKDFYAIWIEELGMWSLDEGDALRLIDEALTKAKEEYPAREGETVKVLYMWNSDTGMIDKWHRYCQRQMRDSYVPLDEKLIFSNHDTKKEDYASKKLEYPLEPGPIDAYDKLMSTLYTPEERNKLEWAIGSIITGDSKNIQKFIVLYGPAGTGKSTILNIMQDLFEGYYSVFDAKALGNSSNAFALESFRNNPLVAIQHDGDLSKIEDNTRLNSLVSHEYMMVNEKFKATYPARFNAFLFMGTNSPVKITDARSGLLRRLIDVSPSGNKLGRREYKQAIKQTKFELGAIAHHCKEVYLSNPGKYDDYVPLSMMGASNDFYNFVVDSYHIFKKEDGTTLKAAWEMYKNYCEEAKVPYPFSQRIFKEELKNYFWDYKDRLKVEGDSRVRSYYSGFRTDKFEEEVDEQEEIVTSWLRIDSTESIFDKECKDYFAQYATSKETPRKAWDDVNTKLSGIDTSKIHYVKVPENHIVIDFDIKGADGKKSLERNIEEASKWPATYAEFSKSGAGIHLHYIYSGDPTKLSRVYDDQIEVKVFTGKSSLRRKLTKCNNLPIATINSGLPLKGETKMVNSDVIKNEKHLRTLIKRNLNKEYHAATKPSIDFIYQILEDAYNSDLSYDVSDMRNAVLAFAASSTNQAPYCIKLVNKMQFKSAEPSIGEGYDADGPLVFFDVEVFPNLFLVNWKFQGEGKPVVRMINPKPSEIEDLIKFKLVGFNNRNYDNHMIYACLLGYTNEQLYKLSKKLISNDPQISRKAKFGEAYNLSYTDVYDFSSEKKSLKKWEIDLGIHHKELGLDWDTPVPEDRWIEVAEYCDNDVIATEVVFNERQADFVARQIQVELVKALHPGVNASVNDTTNTLSTKIIFGNNKNPQNEFNYRDMSQPVGSDQYEEYRRKFGPDYKFRVFDSDGIPLYKDYVPHEELPDGYSILPFFKGYTFTNGVSTYLGEEIGEGGKVYFEDGMYGNVWDGDIASQHPHSVIFEVLFGPKFTKVFEDIVRARVAIKHRDFETAGSLLGGVLKPYLNEEQAADLAQALKIIINSIYGLTSASFPNAFNDDRNKDNIVAKRGSLFMTLLKREVQRQGYTVAHIKTDSIKIPDASQKIIDFVTKFGAEFGYTFETEANFEKFCLVNKAVYVAKFKDGKNAGKWTATGKQFAVPYVHKKLFTKESITVDDMRETFSVKTALYLDINEKLPNVEMLEKEYAKIVKDEKAGKTTDYNRKKELEELIAEGHNYKFIGRIGEFCPVKPGCGGGLLVAKRGDKYDSATGAKGYRWLESELALAGDHSIIDRSYYDKLVDDAVDTISKYGDFEWFVSDDPYEGSELQLERTLPF